MLVTKVPSIDCLRYFLKCLYESKMITVSKLSFLHMFSWMPYNHIFLKTSSCHISHKQTITLSKIWLIKTENDLPSKKNRFNQTLYYIPYTELLQGTVTEFVSFSQPNLETLGWSREGGAVAPSKKILKFFFRAEIDHTNSSCT